VSEAPLRASTKAILGKALAWAIPVVALLILGLTVTPAEIWAHPAFDATYTGFDPNLMYATGGGSGRVEISARTIKLVAVPDSQPSVNLATSPLDKLSASIDVSVLESSGATQPFRIGVWTPLTNAGYFVVFQPGTNRRITADAIDSGGAGPTLAGGNIVRSIDLGGYDLGEPYRLAFLVDRAQGFVSASVSRGQSQPSIASVDAQVLPALFRSPRLSLTASAAGGQGGSTVVLSDYTMALPHQRFWASRIDDARVQISMIVLAIAATVLVVVAIGIRVQRRSIRDTSDWIRRLVAAWGSRIGSRWRVGLLVSGSIGLYLVGNALLFPLGGHPFDIAAEKLYAYVAQTQGPTQLYYLPNVVSLAQLWNGVPISELGFPYGPAFAYLAAAIGWLGSHLFAGGGQFRLESVQLEYVVKSANVMFGLADSALIYAILRQIRVSNRWSLIAAALFMFNPAVWFNMSVWGQTHAISLFFVLATIWFAEKDWPLLAWLALVAACLTRPQMVVFGLLLGIVLLKKFSWPRNVVALSWTVILTFLVLLPFTLATSPSLPIDITLNNFRVQQGGGNDVSPPVSMGAYSIWPLVTYLINGASGLQRALTPSTQSLVGPLTYQRAGLIATIGTLLFLGVALMFRKRADFEFGGYLPLVALGIVSFLMLLTGILSTYFLLALPLLLLCRRRMSNMAYFYILAIWTITTFVAMYGEMGAVLSSQDYPLLAPAHNLVTRFFVNLYSWDRFITVAVVGDICALIWLAFLTFKAPLRQASALAAASK
jgi:hypothetical protein